MQRSFSFVYSLLFTSVFLLFGVVVTQVFAAQNDVITAVGTGTAGYNADGIAANTAQITNQLRGIATDSNGDLFIADYINHRIRKVDVGTGLISTIAGTGVSGTTGDGALATAAQIELPVGIVIDSNDNLYFSQSNDVVRRINAVDGIITTVAGVANSAGYSGDGGQANVAQLNTPFDLAVDSNDDLYIADQANHVLRKVDVSTGIIETFAGNGDLDTDGDGGLATAAGLVTVTNVAVDANDDVYVTFLGWNRIRKIDSATGIIDAAIGTGVQGISGDGGPALTATLASPRGMTFDAQGNMFISESSLSRIRKVDSNGIISTVAGTGVDGFSGDGGAALSAQFGNPSHVAISGNNLFIADTTNNRIRRIEGIVNVESLALSSSTPVSNTVNIIDDADIVMIFNDSLNPTTVNQSNIPVYGSHTGLLAGTYTLSTTSVSNDTVTFNPTSNFEFGEEIRVSVTNNVQGLGTSPLAKGHQLQFFVEAGDGTGVFVAQPLLSGQFPVASRSADFDNDGDIDIAAVGGGSPGKLEVFLNQGDGTFAATVSTNVLNNARALTIGDFNKDGFVDIAVSHNGTTSVSILLNNGSGAFPSKTDVATGSFSQGISSGDFDGDGDIDLVVPLYATSDLLFLINDGNGVFTTGESIATAGIFKVQTADVDLDGDLDIIHTKGSDLDVRVYLNKGDGSFAPSIAYTGTGTGYFDLQVADLNGDQYPDILVGEVVTGLIVVLANDGDGTFAAATSFPVTKPEGITLSDFDNDGDMDVIAVNNTGDTVTYLENNGSASFTTINTYPIGSNPSGISSADYNNDGAIDFVSSDTNDGTLSVFFNTPAQLEVLSITPDSNEVDVSRTSTVQTVFDRSLNTATVTSSSYRVWGTQSGLMTGTFSFSTTTLADDTLTFTPDNAFFIGERVYVSMSSAIQSTGALALTKAYTHEFRIEATAGTAAFVDAAEVPSTGNMPYDVVSADLDGDDILDLVVANLNDDDVSVYIGDGDGTFSLAVDYATGAQPSRLSLIDVENDGDMDIVSFNKAVPSLSLLKNNGFGVFAAKIDYGAGTSGIPEGLTTADFNGDGYMDIAAAFGGSQMDIFLNDTTGAFPTQVTYVSDSVTDLEASDIDNDGDMDVSILYNAISVDHFLNQGNGVFLDGPAPSTTVGVTVFDIESGDMNGDTYQDFLVGSTDLAGNDFLILLNDTDTTFTSGGQNAFWDVLAVTTGDADADGDLDFLGAVSRAGSDFLRIGTNNGAGVVSAFNSYDTGDDPRSIVSGDFDGDGAIDIVSANRTVNTLSVKLNVVPNVLPVATVPTAVSQLSDGTGHISFQTSVSDANSDTTRLQVQYSDDGGSNFYDAELVSVTPSAGTTELNNATQYQIGSTDAIDTDSGSKTLTIVWDSKSASNANGAVTGEQNDIQLRVIPNDSIGNGSAQTTANFSVDNQTPVGLTALVSSNALATTVDLTWSAVTETNFDHYEIWYSEIQAEVVNKSGSATEWDDSDDILLANSATTATTVTGLDAGKSYFFKIYAVDSFGNEETVLEISLDTASAGGRRRTSRVTAIEGSVSEGDSVILEDSSVNDGTVDEGEMVSEGSNSIGLSDELKGSALERSFNALETFVALENLFAWMQEDDYELLNSSQDLLDQYEQLFKMRGMIKALAKYVELSNGYEFQKGSNEPLENIAELLKTLVFSFSDCFTTSQIDRALSHDVAGNGWWWSGYWFFLEGLIENPKEAWDGLDELNVLSVIRIMLSDYCPAQG